MNPDQLSLPLTQVLFAGGALVIALADWRLAASADRLSDLTGLGGAMFGVVLSGAVTSLPGIVVDGLGRIARQCLVVSTISGIVLHR